MKNKLVILSGGMDSTIMLYDLIYNKKIPKENIIALSFKLQNKIKKHRNYRLCLFQNNYIELKMAQFTTKHLKINHVILDVTYLNDILNVMRKDDRFKEGNKKSNKQTTSMPFRNMILLSNALAQAQIYNCDEIFIGFQKQDQYGYWDTNMDFVNAINNVAKLNPDANNVKIQCPFVEMSKHEELNILKQITNKMNEGAFENILSSTWTCYNPIWANKINERYGLVTPINNTGYLACGYCKSCLERLSNFEKLNIKDPLWYCKQEKEYLKWASKVQNEKITNW